MKLIFLLLVVLMVACSSPTEQAGCDLWLGSAVVTGVARDFDGIPMADKRVLFWVATTAECDPADIVMVTGATTGADGRFQALLQLGNQAGTRCVFGQVERSDSVSSGDVWFTSSCESSESPDTLTLDLVVPLSSYLPPDLVISIYRRDGQRAGPNYRACVDATGYVEYEGLGNVAVLGSASAEIEPLAVARLYRSFQQLNYWSLSDDYSGENCEPYVYDVHYCRTTVTADGAFKQVGHDHGCVDVAALEALAGLECEIDSVLATATWTGDWSWPCRD